MSAMAKRFTARRRRTTTGNAILALAAFVLCAFLSRCSRQHPEPPAAPTGPSWARVGRTCEVVVSTPDGPAASEDELLSYRVDWGDSAVSHWSAYIPSSADIAFSHIWQRGGRFAVKAQSRNREGRTSEWSDPLLVSVLADPGYPSVLLDSIYIGGSPSSMAVSPDGQLIYISDDSQDSLAIVRVADDSVISRPTAREADNVCALPDGQHLALLGEYIWLCRASDFTVVDSTELDDPRAFAVSIDGSRIYVVDWWHDCALAFSLPGLDRDTVLAVVEVELSSIAVPANSPFVYVTGEHCLYVIRTADYAMVKQVWAGESPDIAVASPDGRSVYVADGDYLAVVNTEDNAMRATIDVGYGIREMTPLPSSEFVFLHSGNQREPTLVLDADSLSVVDTFRFGANCAAAALPDGTRLYVLGKNGWLRIIGFPDTE